MINVDVWQPIDKFNQKLITVEVKTLEVVDNPDFGVKEFTFEKDIIVNGVYNIGSLSQWKTTWSCLLAHQISNEQELRPLIEKSLGHKLEKFIHYK